ncbi:MAG: ABC transporter ATP-binding protein [Oscillospiraceae bacterium]|nr:ABC transporter ATP-binding protein [Oscillospiraceae bacterium]
MNGIEIHSLTKRYRDVTAVDGVSLTVPIGEAVALLGVNGAGKSTLINMLCGLITPDSGDAFLMGNSIRTDAHAAKGCLALSPQETAIAPNLTVRENLELMAGLCGIGKSAADEILQRFHMEPIDKKRAGKLSGGWQRRLSIAMALITQPKILFLDEPTLGLDILARHELWNEIRALRGSVTLVLTTHYLEEATALCNRIVIMNRGKICAVGTEAELIRLSGAADFSDAFVKLAAGEEIVCEP